ncbi:hypothetical protein M408DRAFT_212138 [Serendipita vermifera MAFF 305830]|uniref:F-box domain-containing protein n=1 Tax=Serendipita vermifera MAFF 305830 TaxID=933852 RepID=A0A0C3AZ99_SERVB|nr:hypothetical protein M408DRAFT_212138 [Serendipita vermifera MAFF 305830]
MWTPTDPNALPSQNETLYAKKAQTRIAAWKNEIQDRRAWIAPVRKLPTEILAQIFVYYSSFSRLAPITITEVCHFWRQVIFTTPQAWSFIYSGGHLCEDELRYLPLFLERSKPCLVHIRISESSKYDRHWFSNQISFSLSILITAHLNRISCLDIHDLDVERLSNVIFPNLTRLEITGSIQNDFPLNKVHFPSLQYLDCRACRLVSGPPGTEYPPLQYLSFYADPYQRWVQVVKGCARSLRALAVRGTFFNEDTIPVISFVFPVLTYLALEEYTKSNSRSPSPLLHAVTPKLVSYEETFLSSHLPILLHEDVRHVVHLRTNSSSQIVHYSSLRFLQLNLILPHENYFISSMETLLKPLREDPTVCPAVEEIEFFSLRNIYDDSPGKWERMKTEAKEKVQTPRSWIKLTLFEGPSALPGSLVDIQCKHGTPHQ